MASLLRLAACPFGAGGESNSPSAERRLPLWGSQGMRLAHSPPPPGGGVAAPSGQVGMRPRAHSPPPFGGMGTRLIILFRARTPAKKFNPGHPYVNVNTIQSTVLVRVLAWPDVLAASERERDGRIKQSRSGRKVRLWRRGGIP